MRALGVSVRGRNAFLEPSDKEGSMLIPSSRKKRQRLVSTGVESAPLCSLRVAGESRRGMKNEFELEISA